MHYGVVVKPGMRKQEIRNEEMIITFGNHNVGMMEPKAAASYALNQSRKARSPQSLFAGTSRQETSRTFASHIRWDKLYQLLSLSNE